MMKPARYKWGACICQVPQWRQASMVLYRRILMALFFVIIPPGMLFRQQCRTGLYNVRAQRPRECFWVMLRILLQAHGVLMAVSFVAILPISAIFAATRDRLFGPRVWFQTHRALGVRHLPFSH